MKALTSWIFAYWLNSLWQIALIFAAAWMVARLARRTGPRTEHRVWVGSLLLQVGLPFCSFSLGGLWLEMQRLMLWLSSGAGAGGSVRVVVGGATVHGTASLRPPMILLAVIFCGYLCSLVYFAARLAWGFWRARSLLRHSMPLSSIEARQKLDHYAELLGISLPAIHLAASSQISGPVMLGFAQATLLLPVRFTETAGPADLDAVFAHELAHLKRHDFPKNLLYEVMTLPVAWHPLVWLTRAQIAGTREMVCDAMASDAAIGRERYAHSLLRLAALLAGGNRTNPIPAIGIFDGDILERRIMNLKQKRETRTFYRVAIAALCGVAALATCSSALAFRVSMDDSPQATNQTKKVKKVAVSSGVMQGNLIEKVLPAYPEEPKKNKVEGTVVLAATINKTGAVENLKVVSGPEQLRQSALDAVRQWHYKPYLLNGDPVEVETTVNVVYNLDK